MNFETNSATCTLANPLTIYLKIGSNSCLSYTYKNSKTILEYLRLALPHGDVPGRRKRYLDLQCQQDVLYHGHHGNRTEEFKLPQCVLPVQDSEYLPEVAYCIC